MVVRSTSIRHSLLVSVLLFTKMDRWGLMGFLDEVIHHELIL
jgi:hypothetical protein